MDKFEILETLLIAVVPAFLLYLIARLQGKRGVRKAGNEIKAEIERLSRQHEIDVQSLKEKHAIEMEAKEEEHLQKIELMEKELEAQQKKQNQTDFSSYHNRLTFEILAKIMESPVEGFKAVENISKLAQTLSSEKECP